MSRRIFFDGLNLALQRGTGIATLGTPVVTSRAASLPEVAGDAALYVNPHDIDDIAAALRTIAGDKGLAAELARRGRKQAELFSVARYRERVADLYRRIG